MRVIATAGHVDHGKSTLLRALTGMDPDRWTEEHRRGLTIDLGFVWTELDGQPFAFVDVPGHQRFVANMLAGVGPVPAALFVVAADEGWMPQSEEHLAALDAFGVRHGLLAVTKSDRAEAKPALRQALERIAHTSLGKVPGVVVSARTGEGLDELRECLTALAGRLPDADAGADVRLWVDRSFSVRGAGTVVTGTLGAGAIRVGDELELASTGELVGIRGMQSLGGEIETALPVARVALNLRKVPQERVARGDALLTPRRWLSTRVVDVRLRATDSAEPHREAVLHLGSSATPVRVRGLGPDTARLTLSRSLPMRCGDAGLLRDPGEHAVVGVEVLDMRPPGLRRRGDAAARADELAAADIAAAHVRRAEFVAENDLRAMGLSDAGVRVAGWIVDGDYWAKLPERLIAAFDAWARQNPLASGMPAAVLCERLGLPAGLFKEAVRNTSLQLDGDGLARRDGEQVSLPRWLAQAARSIQQGFEQHPFRAPDAGTLAALGVGPRELAAAERAGELVRIADGIVLGPDAVARAATELAALEQPFTVSQARQALGSTRRVMVPLLERLDADGFTEALRDGTRRCRDA